jgi:hypothetical protein
VHVRSFIPSSAGGAPSGITNPRSELLRIQHDLPQDLHRQRGSPGTGIPEQNVSGLFRFMAESPAFLSSVKIPDQTLTYQDYHRKHFKKLILVTRALSVS